MYVATCTRCGCSAHGNSYSAEHSGEHSGERGVLRLDCVRCGYPMRIWLDLEFADTTCIMLTGAEPVPDAAEPVLATAKPDPYRPDRRTQRRMWREQSARRR